MRKCTQTKQRKFREKYFDLTRELILFTGNSTPFYVWMPGTNKYGKQLRVYFDGKVEVAPKTPKPLRVTKGRTASGLRINGTDFVFNLFAIGFALGKNVDCAENIKSNVPPEFTTDFSIGLNLASPIEEMEMLVFEHCKQNGNLTAQSKNLQKLWGKKDISASTLLDELCKNKTLIKNSKQNAYTLFNIERLRGEIENRTLQRAIDLELDNKQTRDFDGNLRTRPWLDSTGKKTLLVMFACLMGVKILF